MRRILVVNGPNLNLLGEREPEVYGSSTVRDLYRLVRDKADELGCKVTFFQSNHEGEIIDFLHDHRLEADGLLINPGGLTHCSVALLDALKAIGLPAVEVHISDISKREEFRQKSLIGTACIVQIVGMGIGGYAVALERLVERLHESSKDAFGRHVPSSKAPK